MDEEIPQAESYRELAKWLFVQADCALTLARQLERGAAEPVPPDPWREVSSAGPPAHWLALLEQEEALEWIDSQDVDQPGRGSPDDQGSGHSEEESDPSQETEAAHAGKYRQNASAAPPQADPGEFPGGEPKMPAKRGIEGEISPARPDLPEKEAPSRTPPLRMEVEASDAVPEAAETKDEPSTGQTTPPAETLPVHHTTRLRLNSMTEAVGPVHRPDAEAPIADSDGQVSRTEKLVTAHQPFANETLPGRPELSTPDGPHSEAHPVDAPSSQSASFPVWLRLKPARGQKSFSLSQPQSGGSGKPETHLRLPGDENLPGSRPVKRQQPAGLRESTAAAQLVPSARPATIESAEPIQHTVHPASARPAAVGSAEPVPHTAHPASAQPNPPRHPPTAGRHWPSLPLRDFQSGEDTEDKFDACHRQRIDEEQKGRPWNA